MITIKEVIVDNMFTVDRVRVTFKTNDFYEDVSRFRFDIYRSEHQSQDFYLLAYDVKDFEFIDCNVNLKNISISYYYKIRVTDEESGEEIDSDVVKLNSSQPDNFALAIGKIESIYLNNTIKNNTSYLLKKRLTGQLCSCYNKIRRFSNPDCRLCYGTSYLGGYYSQRPIKLSFYNQHQTQVALTQTSDATRLAPLQAWTTADTEIVNNDIIVLFDNTRFVVSNVSRTHKNGFIIRQMFELHHIPPVSPLYGIEVKP